MNDPKKTDSGNPRPPGVVSAIINTLALLTILFVVVPLVASLFAKMHWGLDLLAQFHVQYLLVLIPAALICAIARKWKRAILFAIAALIAGFPLFGYFVPTGIESRATNENATQLKIVSFNVLTSNLMVDRTNEFILSEDPDIVLLYEVNDFWRRNLSPLHAQYPHVKFETRDNNFGVCIFSKVPWTELSTAETGPLGLPSVDAKFDVGRNGLHLIGTHPIPPSGGNNSRSRNAQLIEVAVSLDQSSSRVMAGDFNLAPSSPWFREVKRMGGVEDSALGFGMVPTWYCFPTIAGGLKIDHVLVSPDIRVINHRVGPDLGSDHRAVIVDLEIAE